MDIYTYNIPYVLTRAEIAAPFTHFGRVVNAKQIIGRDGLPRGYGFVSMPQAEEAETAIRALNRKLFFLTNLPAEVSNEDLANYFEDYNQVASHFVNLGNMSSLEEEKAQVSMNRVGYMIFTDEQVAGTFGNLHRGPGSQQLILGSAVIQARVAYVERSHSSAGPSIR